jgi:hypothetical protein
MKNKFIESILNRIFRNYFNKKIMMIGTSHILNMRKNYNSIKNLSEIDFKVFSQNGEDGILDYLLFSLKVEKPKFIEIGVGDYSESNTRFLFERTSCEGLIIDIIDNFENKVKKNTKLWKGNLKILNKKITPSNFLSTLENSNFTEKIDLFSLDIDSYDYWVLKEIPKKFCKLIVVEFNPYFGGDLKITVPLDENFNRTSYHYSNLCFGASLRGIIELLKNKGFIFLGTNLFRNNAFFINQDFKDHLSLNIPDDSKLDNFTDFRFREGRDINNKLSYIDPKNVLKEIKDCKIVDLSVSETKIKKINDFNIKF